MADKAIGELPVAPELYHDSLLVVEQQREARSIKGELISKFAKEEVQEYVQGAVDAAESAKSSAEAAKNDADRAEEMRQSIELDYEYIDTARTEAQASAEAAAESEKAAAASEEAAKASQDAAKASEDAAKTSQDAAEESKTAAAESAESALESKTAADQSAQAAKTSEDAAKASQDAAAVSEQNAAASEEQAGAYNTEARSYAVGDTASREGEDVDNAKYYYEQAKRISQGLAGALLPMGTITFAELETTAVKQAGYMYNISDAFTTTADFREGEGHTYPAGTNVYYTAEGDWDCLAGAQVVSVNGETGAVMVTPASIGAVAKAGDTMTGDLTLSGAARAIKFSSGTRNGTPIAFYEEVDASGSEVVIGDGGRTIIGGGEAAASLRTVLTTTGAAEEMHVASDGSIFLHTNCNFIDNRKTVTIDANGKITAPGGFDGTVPSSLISFITTNATYGYVSFMPSDTVNFFTYGFNKNTGQPYHYNIKKKVNDLIYTASFPPSIAAIGATGSTNKTYNASNMVDILTLTNGTYVFEGNVPSGKNFPADLVGGYYHITINVFGSSGAVAAGGQGYSCIMLWATMGNKGSLFMGGKSWNDTVTWTRITFTDIQHGEFTVKPSAANTPTTGHQTFALAFPGVPHVIVGANNPKPGTELTGVSATNISATGFDAVVTRTNTTVVTVDWIAIYG